MTVRDGSRGQRDVIAGFEGGRGTISQRMGAAPEALKGKARNSLPEPPESIAAQPTP